MPSVIDVARSVRRAALAALTIGFALQVLLLVFYGLFGEDLGLPERTRPSRKLQIVADPELWRSDSGHGGVSPPLVFVDGRRLKHRDLLNSELRETPPRAAPDSVVPSHFRYDRASKQLIVSCPDVLPCRWAAIVPTEPSFAIATGWGRLSRSPLRVLSAAVILAACAGVAFRVSRSANAAQVVAGLAISLGVLATWLSRGSHASPFAVVLIACEAVGFSAPYMLRTHLRRVPGFMADLLLFHDPVEAPRPTWWRFAKVCSLGSVGLLALVSSDALAPPSWETLVPDQHRDKSLEIALNRVLCQADSTVSASIHVATLLGANPGLADVPLRHVLAGAAGSVETYCRSLDRPFINNENSLMIEMAALARAQPRLSIRGLGWGLQTSRILALLLVGYVLLESGASLAFAATVFIAGTVVLGALQDRYYSVYPFLPVLIAMVVATLCLSLHWRLPYSSIRHGVAAGVLGSLIAFAANMRSSHLPLYIALLGIYFFVAHQGLARRLSRWPIQSRASWLAVGVASAGIGYFFVGQLITSRSQKLPTNTAAQGSVFEFPYHVVSHPLVLGLAIPESALSVREGIQWNDEVGLVLARRVNPEVGYLRGAYESALFTYYVRLWTRHPAEMCQIYLAKFRLAGKNMLVRLWEEPDSLAGASFFRALTLPLSWMPDGLILLFLYAVAFGVSTFVHLRRGSSMAFVVSLFAATALLLQVECAVIYPFFFVSHQASQLTCMLILSAFVWQLAVEALGVAVRSTWTWLSRTLSTP